MNQQQNLQNTNDNQNLPAVDYSPFLYYSVLPKTTHLHHITEYSSHHRTKSFMRNIHPGSVAIGAELQMYECVLQMFIFANKSMIEVLLSNSVL